MKSSTIKDFFYDQIKDDADKKFISVFDGKKSKIQLELSYANFKTDVEILTEKLPPCEKTIIYLDNEAEWWKIFFAVMINGGTVVVINDKIEIEYAAKQIKEAK